MKHTLFLLFVLFFLTQGKLTLTSLGMGKKLDDIPQSQALDMKAPLSGKVPGESCGTHDRPEINIKGPFDILTPACGQTNCDDATTRDKYTSKIANTTYRVNFIVPNCYSWSGSISTLLNAAMSDLNAGFAEVGVTFEGYLYSYTCQDSYKLTTYENYRSAIAAYTGTIFFQLTGSFLVLVGQTSTDQTAGSGGWMEFPWTSTHGTAFLNYWSLTTAQYRQTIVHEFGHGFGLRHTFAGVSEWTKCSTCQVKTNAATNEKGDFCADTPEHPRVSSQCTAPINYDDGCVTSTTWTQALLNLMSYSYFCSGTKFFSPQQVRRMRCYQATKFSWLSNVHPNEAPASLYISFTLIIFTVIMNLLL